MSKFGDEFVKAAESAAGLAARESDEVDRALLQQMAEGFDLTARNWPADAAGVLSNDGFGSLSWIASTPPEQHVLATTTGLGAAHSVSGLTPGQVLKATGAAVAAFGILGFSELLGSVANVQVPQSAVTQHQAALVIDWAQIINEPLTFPPSPHTLSGLDHTGTLAYSQLPTGSGSWDSGVGTTITITRALTVAGGPLTVSASGIDVTGASTFNGAAVSMGALTISAAQETLISAKRSDAGIVGYEFGSNDATGGSVYLDLHVASGVDYHARIVRNSGVNGQLRLVNTGTGTFVVQADAHSFRNAVDSAAAPVTMGALTATSSAEAGIVNRTSDGRVGEFRRTGGTNNPGLFVEATEATKEVVLNTSGSVGPFQLAFAMSNVKRLLLNGNDLSLSPATAGALTLGTTLLPWKDPSFGFDASNRLDITISPTGAVTYDAVGTGALHTFSDPVTATGLLTASASLKTASWLDTTADVDLLLKRNAVTKLTLASAGATFADIGIFPASTTSAASLRMPHGSAPTTPTNGDHWSTTAGAFVRVNGATFNYAAGSPDPLRLSDGSAAAPTYSFSLDTDTGVYRAGVDQIAFAAGGAATAVLAASSVSFGPSVAQFDIKLNTADGSDTKAMQIGGGGGIGNNRGAYLTLKGNEAVSSPGSIQYNAGDVVGAIHEFRTGASVLRVTIDSGIQVGAPTGGDKGAGTINVAGDIFKNNTAYSNPDWRFEAYLKGWSTRAPNRWQPRSLQDIRQYVGLWQHLPGFHRDRPVGVFGRGDLALEKVEDLYIHTFSLDDRLTRVERALRVAGILN